jgi:phosphoribosyl 1,2-cyclic phosphodiesterase
MEKSFQITFRGVRGSIGTPITLEQIEDKLTKVLERVRPEDLEDADTRKSFIDSLPFEVRGCFGGNTPCVQMEVGGENLILDGGTGIRQAGQDLMKGEFGQGKGRAHLLFSHTHWDHIQGLPFFAPFRIEGNHFTILSPHNNIKKRLEGQQSREYFPVPFDAYQSTLDFPDLDGKSEVRVGDVKISWKEMCHPGKSYAYRVEYAGKSVVYATDAEYKDLSAEKLQPYVEFFRDADLLIFDSMFTFGDGLERRDWGHSSTFIGVDLAVDANVKEIAFFHHDPRYDDFKLADIFSQTQNYLKSIASESKLKMFVSYEDLTVDLLPDESSVQEEFCFSVTSEKPVNISK